MQANDVLDSWLLFLASERKSPQTLKSYGDGVRSYVTYCDEAGIPDDLARGSVVAWIAAMLERGASPATATARQLAVRRFSAWCAAEGEIDADPLLGLRAPKRDIPLVEPLTDEQIGAMLAVCRGTTFRHLRNAAVLRLMTETGLRASECVNLETADLDLMRGVAVVRRGKGGKARMVPFSPTTASAIDRYLRRARKPHRLAETPALWLGDRGKTWGYDALHAELGRIAAAAGVEGFHPHRLRHTAAHRWLVAGGSETGLMAVAGWERADMIQRYTRARATDRALAEARTLDLGDL